MSVWNGLDVALQVGWEAPPIMPILLSSATAVTASASPSLCTIRRSSCSSPVAASCGSACSRTFKTWRLHFHSWTWTPLFKKSSPFHFHCNFQNQPVLSTPSSNSWASKGLPTTVASTPAITAPPDLPATSCNGSHKPILTVP